MTVTRKTINAFLQSHLQSFLTWGVPFIVLSSYSFLSFLPDFRLIIPTLLGVTAGIIVILAITLYAGEKGAVHWSPGMIMVIAVILRLLFLFRSPDLSDDIYRYLWDGLQILNGHNPYSLAPSNIQTRNNVLVELLKHINHPHLVTIYPPAAQIVFTVGALLRTALGMKALLIVIDLMACAFILRLLSVYGLPAWRSVLYAWHPLPIIEIAASGHIDGAGISLFFITLLLLTKKSAASPQNICSKTPSQYFTKSGLLTFLAGLAFSFAFLVKLLPLIYLPVLFFLIRSRCRISFIIGILTGGIVLILPFLPDLENMLMTLNLYLQNWEFSGLLFRALRLIASSGNVARLILTFAFILAIMFLFAMFWLKKRSMFRTLYNITFVFLILTPTLHPWYVLYLVCLLPFVPGLSGLSLSWSILLSYRILIPFILLGQWIEDDTTPALIWVAPIATFFLIEVSRKLWKRTSDLRTIP